MTDHITKQTSVEESFHFHIHNKVLPKGDRLHHKALFSKNQYILCWDAWLGVAMSVYFSYFSMVKVITYLQLSAGTLNLKLYLLKSYFRLATFCDVFLRFNTSQALTGDHLVWVKSCIKSRKFFINPTFGLLQKHRLAWYH